jgi:hypothetical protein
MVFPCLHKDRFDFSLKYNINSGLLLIFQSQKDRRSCNERPVTHTWTAQLDSNVVPLLCPSMEIDKKSGHNFNKNEQL